MHNDANSKSKVESIINIIFYDNILFFRIPYIFCKIKIFIIMRIFNN